MKKMFLLSILCYLSFVSSLYAKELSGTWQQVDTNAGLCKFCQVSILQTKDITTIQASNLNGLTWHGILNSKISADDFYSQIFSQLRPELQKRLMNRSSVSEILVGKLQWKKGNLNHLNEFINDLYVILGSDGHLEAFSHISTDYNSGFWAKYEY